MALDTYAALQTSVAAFVNRDNDPEFVAAVPDFIRIAEAETQRALEHWRMDATASLSISTRYTALPADFLAPRRLQIALTEKPLALVLPDYLHEQRVRYANSTGVPIYYTIVAGQIEVWPTPEDTYTAEFYYRRTIPALSDANTSNWLLALAPDVYLYGALKQTAPFLQEDNRVATWGGMYAAAVASLKAEGERGQWGGQLNMRVKR